jgi:hypothetical protein
MAQLESSRRGIASQLLGKLIANEEANVNSLNLLRHCLSLMGATPTDSSKISPREEDNRESDPADKYF